jgi:hypothetical protein
MALNSSGLFLKPLAQEFLFCQFNHIRGVGARRPLFRIQDGPAGMGIPVFDLMGWMRFWEHTGDSGIVSV